MPGAHSNRASRSSNGKVRRGMGCLTYAGPKPDRQTEQADARPAKSLSPSRQGIKKGTFPSPAVSDGIPSPKAGKRRL